MGQTIITVHGVGQAEPGAISKTLAATLNFGVCTEVISVYRGFRFLELRDNDSARSIVEVNWSDLVKPRSSGVGVIRHVWYLLTSMVDMLAEGPKALGAKAYRWALFTMTPGAAIFLSVTGFSTLVADNWLRRSLLFAMIIGAAATVLSAREVGRYIDWLWAWFAGALFVAGLSFFHPLPLEHIVQAFARQVRALAFFSVLLTVNWAALESFFAKRHSSTLVRLSNLAFLYIPFIAMNSLMSWVSLLGMAYVKRLSPTLYPTWEQNVLQTRFDLGRVELGATVVFGVLGLLSFLLPWFEYRFPSQALARDENINASGRGAQNAVAQLLGVTPVALIVLAIYTLAVILARGKSSEHVLDIYKVSVWRTLPYLAWLVGPLSVALKITGDVLFYLQPSATHPAAVGQQCRARLEAALDYAKNTYGRTPVIVAHSQGTVIAADVLSQRGFDCPLITLGSPIESLYARFLGVFPGGRSLSTDIHWINGYRTGDFIAGPIVNKATKNELIGKGGHFNYFSETVLAKYLLELQV